MFTVLSASPEDRSEKYRHSFLTPEDLGTSTHNQRSYMSGSFSGLEEDLDRMAANYVPEENLELELDLELENIPEQGIHHRDSTAFQLPTTPKFSAKTKPGADPNLPIPMVNKQEDETGQAPTSWSIVPGIADPVLDDETGQFMFQDLSPERQTSSVNNYHSSESMKRGQDRDSTDSSSLSSQEFRSKFAFSETEISFPSMLVTDQSFASPTIPAVESSRRQDELFSLQESIKRLEKDITIANNGIPINLSSYKQVSQALFGTPNESTSKTVLEGMALSNVLAKLILEHRQTQQRYNKLRKKEQAYKTKAIITKTDPLEEPLLLVDTSSFIFRAYYSMPPMHRADGMPVSAVLGFCNMLNRMVLNPLLEGKQPRLVLCCDAPSPASGGPKTMRHELYNQYKAHRQEAPMDLIPQFPLFRMAAQAYGMMWIEAPGYEADDVIASLAQKAIQEGLTVHIYSGDKDLMQLITNSTNDQGKIIMIDPMTMTHWDHESVVEKWGVPAHQLGDVLALAGDSADNIPGVPGIGPKIAAQLIQQFGTVEELLANLDQVPQVKRREKLELYRGQALLSQQLVRLERELDWDAFAIDFPVPPESFERPDRVIDLRMQVMNPDRILRFYDQMGFVTIKERLLERLQRQSNFKNNHSSPTTNVKRPSYKRPSREKAEVPKPEDFDGVPF